MGRLKADCFRPVVFALAALQWAVNCGTIQKNRAKELAFDGNTEIIL